MGDKLFDFCLGNPPYQRLKNKKNIDVWPDFVTAGNMIAGKNCMVHPGRWVVPKKTMERVRDDMLGSGLKHFDYVPDSMLIFDDAQVDGGITVSYYDAGYELMPTYAINGTNKGNYDCNKLVFTTPELERAFSCVSNKFGNFESIKKRIIGVPGSPSGREYGYYKATDYVFLQDTPSGLKDPVKIWASKDFGKRCRLSWFYIDRCRLKKTELLDRIFSSRKVMLDKKGHELSLHKTGNIINNIPQIIEKDMTAESGVFFVFPEHDIDYELELIKSYFMTRMIRFLLCIVQKGIYVCGFENLPDYMYFVDALHGNLFTDDFLYDFFGVDADTIEYIEAHVSEKKEKTVYKSKDMEGLLWEVQE